MRSSNAKQQHVIFENYIDIFSKIHILPEKDISNTSSLYLKTVDNIVKDHLKPVYFDENEQKTIEDKKLVNKKYLKKHRIISLLKRSSTQNLINKKNYTASLIPCFNSSIFKVRTKKEKELEDKKLRDMKKKLDLAAKELEMNTTFKARAFSSGKKLKRSNTNKNDFFESINLNLNSNLIEDTFKRIKKLDKSKIKECETTIPEIEAEPIQSMFLTQQEHKLYELQKTLFNPEVNKNDYSAFLNTVSGNFDDNPRHKTAKERLYGSKVISYRFNLKKGSTKKKERSILFSSVKSSINKSRKTSSVKLDCEPKEDNFKSISTQPVDTNNTNSINNNINTDSYRIINKNRSRINKTVKYDGDSILSDKKPSINYKKTDIKEKKFNKANTINQYNNINDKNTNVKINIENINEKINQDIKEKTIEKNNEITNNNKQVVTDDIIKSKIKSSDNLSTFRSNQSNNKEKETNESNIYNSTDSEKFNNLFAKRLKSSKTKSLFNNFFDSKSRNALIGVLGHSKTEDYMDEIIVRDKIKVKKSVSFLKMFQNYNKYKDPQSIDTITNTNKVNTNTNNANTNLVSATKTNFSIITTPSSPITKSSQIKNNDIIKYSCSFITNKIKGISEVIITQRDYTSQLSEVKETQSYFSSRPELKGLKINVIDKDRFKESMKFCKNLQSLNINSSLKFKDMYKNQIVEKDKKELKDNLLNQLKPTINESNKISNAINLKILKMKHLKKDYYDIKKRCLDIIQHTLPVKVNTKNTTKKIEKHN